MIRFLLILMFSFPAFAQERECHGWDCESYFQNKCPEEEHAPA